MGAHTGLNDTNDARTRQIVLPPSITTEAPVMYDDASEMRNITAPLYSSFRAILPIGIRA